MNDTGPGSTLGRLGSLIEAAATVVGQTDLTDVLRKSVETAIELTGARFGALGVIGEHGVLVEFLHSGMDPAVVERIGKPPVGRGVLGTITKLAKTVRVDSISDHPDSVGFPEHHPPMGAFLGVPISVGERVFGNLYLTEKDGGFTNDDEVVIEDLARIAGAAISTSRLQRRLRRVAVIEDRERIARDLHDAIIQDLFAVGLSLQAQGLRIDDDEVRRHLDDAVERLDDAITELRRFIFDLRPPVWTERNLRHEIDQTVAELTAGRNVEVATRFDGGVDDLATSLYDDVLATISEAVSNAMRHAEASRVEVDLQVDDGCLKIIVTDTGNGFDPESVRLGMGIENMRTRAGRAGGEATISSTPGQGTVVKVELPI